MKLEGKIIKVDRSDDAGFVNVTLKIRVLQKPYEPDCVDARDEEHSDHLLDNFVKQTQAYVEQMKAIENLGMRNATLIFGDNVVVVDGNTPDQGDETDDDN